ncbi:AlpA family phage regulatory protein [Pseudomonas sp. NPDC007930]|uniref:helix-turn-helix transcriptional regulator n=1 Tax=Pseudomonas sp. NPDC007930 TaxID=3364417 RepID=UPI0036EBF52C
MHNSHLKNSPVKVRVLRMKSVSERTGLSRTTLYNLMDPKSKYYDPSFPQRIRLTSRVGGAIGFIEHEIDEWIASKTTDASLGQLPPGRS